MQPLEPTDPPATSDDSAPPAESAGDATVALPATGPVTPPTPGAGPTRKGWLQNLALVAGGLFVPFALLASDRRFPFSISLVVASLLVAGLGLLRWLGAWPERSHSDIAPTRDLKPALWLAAGAAGFVLATTLAVKGVYPLPRFSSGLLITATFLALVVATFRFGRSLGYWGPDADGTDRPLHQRHGFWLLTLSALLYLPWLGNFGLIDPWETHYGEVSREMIARDDWISLWWAHDGWFWSKPILNFWLQGLSFKLFGVNAMPDQMLLGISQGRWPEPEWACRLPVFFLTVVGGYTLYRGTLAPFGRRAAFLGGLVLSTCPYWYILARQTMADMPYVAPLCAAMGFLMLGMQADPEQLVKTRTLALGRLRLEFSAFHALFLAVLLCCLPQVLYLATRNLTLHTTDMFGFRPHLDEFMRGSGGGNCGQPGNKACTETAPVYVWGQPVAFAALWLGLLIGLLFYQRRERRAQRLYFVAGWLCTAFAVMAKGAPGLVLPLGTLLAFLGTSGRWRDITRVELPALLLLVLIVGMPWYVQMYMRHGYAFFDRLIMHDMVNRAFSHVHDTNKGDEVTFRYYVWQLGYGLFPWTGLCAGGLVWWAARREQFAKLPWESLIWLTCWWLVAFGMFSITGTKFHHYIFPVVPPTAAITGLLLSDLLPKFSGPSWRTLGYFALLFVGCAAVVLGLVLCLPGRLDASVIVDQAPNPGRPLPGVAFVLAGLGAILFGCRLAPPSEVEDATTPASNSATRVGLAALCIAAAGGVALAGRDQFITRAGDVEGQVRLLHLFTYNYERLFPKSLDFKPAFLAFTVTAVVIGLLLALPRVQRHAATLMCSVSILFSAWCIDTYLVKLTPHWGQRETIVKYFQTRANENEKLVAYQMNWKGENFYTGNRMATWVSSGVKFKEWIAKQRERGVKSMFFTTEHARLGTLKKELDNPKQFEVLTNDTLNNKFFLAKVTFDELPAGGTAAKAPGAASAKPVAKPGAKPLPPASKPSAKPAPAASNGD